MPRVGVDEWVERGGNEGPVFRTGVLLGSWSLRRG
jgi:hypothetical protein